MVALSTALTCLAALAPGIADAVRASPAPLIVDTDLSDNADDVGMLATAFAFQQQGQATVLAVILDSEPGTSTVQTNSWKCIAAIDDYYGAPSVPIGTQVQDYVSDDDTPDLVGPCAQLAPAPLAAPDKALNVYRRVLAAAANDSVVIATGGSLGNIADLLRSPADSISPLTGVQLVAQKVKMLVVMGGGYPSRASETNLAADPMSAQFVSSNWPTTGCASSTCPPLVWSGYEIGDVVDSGQTISSDQPHYSPVRAAYEAFVGPNNWIPSYDLTPVYYAVRPTDPVWAEIGPGTNAIDTNGGNVFTLDAATTPVGAGNQFYLTWSQSSSGPSTLAASLEGLLDDAPPPTGTAPANTASPTITGSAVQGDTLTASTGSWTLNGMPFTPASFAYQWEQCDPTGHNCSPINGGKWGAISATYVPTAADAGSTVRAEVWANVPGASSSPTPTPPTTVVPAVNDYPPGISGTAAEGETLTATQGTWEPTAGVTIADRWQRCDSSGLSCTDIDGATSDTYLLTWADAGHTIRVCQTATINGAAATVSSVQTAVVQPLPPTNVGPPTISGAAQQGSSLTATPGSWSPPNGLTVTAQWQLCDRSGASCTTIAGATADTYVVTLADAGDTIRVLETATFDGAANAAMSAQTSVVLPLPPANVTPPTISGLALAGETLSEISANWANDPTERGYQWLQCDSAGMSCSGIPGATSPTYKLTGNDIGHTIAVQETASNAGGSTAATSSTTGVVAATSTPAPTPTPTPTEPVATVPPAPTKPSSARPPVIAGRAIVGQTVRASATTWSGGPPTSETFQWLRCKPRCAPIPGATKDSYRVRAADQGAMLKLVLTAANNAGSTQTTSSEFGPIAPNQVTIRALLARASVPRGGSATIGGLLRSGGYRTTFDAPLGGRLVVSWYYRPNQTGRQSKHAKRVLVAWATVALKRAGMVRIKLTLSAAGQTLLKRTHSVTLTAMSSYTPTGHGTTGVSQRFSLEH